MSIPLDDSLGMEEPQPLVRRRRRRRERRLPAAAVPSFFTLGNLLSGFFSLIEASRGDLEQAAWLIVLAGLFDLLDGMVARFAQADSDFGIELDSLCDVVSFGAAPSFLLYHVGLQDFRFGEFVAALPVLCGAVRLARFNVLAGGAKRDYFVGLPIPAMAATIVAFILTFESDAGFQHFEQGRLSILLPAVVVVSFLMVSPVRFPSLPQLSRATLRRSPRRYLAFLVGGLLVLALGAPGLLFCTLAYLTLGLGGALVWAVRAARDPGGSPPPDDASPTA